MKNLKKLSVYSFVFVAGLMSVLPEAQARVGRPLTPVSVAGVARRTVRRCAVGVYYCKNKIEVPSKLLAQRKG